MSETTAKAQTLEARTVSLLAYPGTPQQRALRTLDGERDDLRRRALFVARNSRYADAPLAWLSHGDQTIHPVLASV